MKRKHEDSEFVGYCIDHRRPAYSHETMDRGGCFEFKLPLLSQFPQKRRLTETIVDPNNYFSPVSSSHRSRAAAFHSSQPNPPST
jgi:hypothetical protein